MSRVGDAGVVNRSLLRSSRPRNEENVHNVRPKRLRIASSDGRDMTPAPKKEYKSLNKRLYVMTKAKRNKER